MVVTADDFGGVKIFNFPCLVEDAPFVRYGGHSSHVSSVSFLQGDKFVVSGGSADRTVILWRYDSGKSYSTDAKVGSNAANEATTSGGDVFPPSQMALKTSYAKIMEEEKKSREEAFAKSDTIGDFFMGVGGGGGKGGGIFMDNPQLANELEALTDYFASIIGGVESDDSDCCGDSDDSSRIDGDDDDDDDDDNDLNALTRRSIERHPLKGITKNKEEPTKENVDTMRTEILKITAEPIQIDDETLKKIGLWEAERGGRYK